ncbi:hypothetical protein SCARR_04715 [Pontiella sulfatireligans]|uniref:Type II secretion system protein G n=2 Tax=Pontiella sulfatireligans TaxID=2750658 RepID=A0A6C2UQR2_9BACT|nr:hypothetical protein SCARR_04715 [Pontiella sulfatireligans]
MKRKHGFTLIETTVTVAVIGLLASIALPSFSVARTRVLYKTKQSNTLLLNNAVQEWAMDSWQPDDAKITAALTNYINGGLEALSVGEARINLTNITSRTVDHEFTIENLY